MNTILAALSAAMMIGLATPTAAEKPQDIHKFAKELSSRIERFFLWNNCRPIRADVDLWSDGAESDLSESALMREIERSLGTSLFGLSPDTAIAAIQHRLQEAHLRDDRAETRLRIRVHVSGDALRIEVDYVKPVLDLASRERWFADTWRSRSERAHNSDGKLVLSLVMKDVDHFIDEYLRVNRDACEKLPSAR